MTPRTGWLDESFLRRMVRVGTEVARVALTRPRHFWASLQQYAAQSEAANSPLQYLNGLPSVCPLNLVLDAELADRPHLNVLLPGVAMRAMSGGPNTLINLAYRMAARGVAMRFISTDIPADRDPTALWAHFAALTGVQQPLPNVEMCCAFDRSRPFPIGENDVFFASAWWNVQMIKRALPLTKPKRFLYIIQDYEPGLYAWSTEYALALETYSLDYRPFVSEKLLADFLVQHRVGRFADPSFIDRCTVFEPAVDRGQFFPEPQQGERPRRLLFYARPTSARRNLFELGLYALRCCAVEGVFAGERWELFFIGEQLPAGTLDGGVSIVSAPWLDYAGYARLLRHSDVMLSLMLSPHTSYPPLEMAACGGWAVTTIYANKTAAALARLSPNLIGVPPTLEAVVAGIKEAVHRVRSGRPTEAGVNMPPDWTAAFATAVDRAIDAYTDCLGLGV
jgi:WsaF, C-terminal domain/WsaF, N-terminal domain